MASSHFKLSDFKSEVFSGVGLARTNRFEVYITPPRALASRYGGISNFTSLYAESTNVPMLNITTKPFKIFGPSYQRPITSEYGGEGINFTFHVDRNFQVRRFFEDWMHEVIHPERFTVGYLENYATTITIAQLDEQENKTYEIELLEAFPRNINLMELNNASMNQTHRLNVLFAYRYWKRIGFLDTTTPVDIPRVIQNPQVPVPDDRLPETRKQWNWSTGTLDEQPGSDLPPSA